jgi:hypothetical protein
MVFMALLNNYDEHDIYRLMKCFQVLSQNGSTEKDVMNMYIS